MITKTTRANIANIKSIRAEDVQKVLASNGFLFSKTFSDETTQFFVSNDAMFKAEFSNGEIKFYRTHDTRIAFHTASVKLPVL